MNPATNLDEAIFVCDPRQWLRWEDLSLFVEKKIFGSVMVHDNQSSSREITAKLNFFGIEFESKFDTEPASRDLIRQANERRLAEVTGKISLLSDQIKVKYGKPVLSAG
jgi:hypothetical protein